MIDIEGVIVSTDILTEKFLCDLSACRGICCVEGNSGAPLEADEARILAEEWAAYRPFMTLEGAAEIERQGFAVVDSDGDLVTPLVGDAECAYSYKVDPSHSFGMTNDSADCHSEGSDATRNLPCTLCAIEKAWSEGRTAFRKPVSCHLYPIRVARFGDGSLGLNYHRWAVCEGARQLGRERGVPMYKMLREPIVRRFGEEFFAALEAAEKYLAKE